MNAVTTQTAYSETIAVGLPGQIVNTRAYDGITRTCEPATLDFGIAVCQGTDKVRGVTVGGALAAFLGITVRDITLINSTMANVDKYEIGVNTGIVTMGEVWARVSVDVVPSDPVYYSATTGIFAKSGGSGPLTWARFMSNTINGLVRVHLLAV